MLLTPAQLLQLISARRLLSDVCWQVSDVGPRPAGSRAARSLARALVGRFRDLGLAVEFEQFPLPMADVGPGAVRVLPDGPTFPVWPFLGDPPYQWYRMVARRGHTRGILTDYTGGRALPASLRGQIALLDWDWNDAAPGLAWRVFEISHRGASGAIFRGSGVSDDHVLAPSADWDGHVPWPVEGLRCPVGGVGEGTGEVLLRQAHRQRPVELTLQLQDRTRPCASVIGWLPGQPEERVDSVLVCAHYDTGIQRPDCVGADDNASGVAVLLEVARAISALRRRQSGAEGVRPVAFLAYDAEEINAIGAWSWSLDLPSLLTCAAGLSCLQAWEGLVFRGSAWYKRAAATSGLARHFGRRERVRHTMAVLEVDACGQGEELFVRYHVPPTRLAAGAEISHWARSLPGHLRVSPRRVPDDCNNVGARVACLGGRPSTLLMRLADLPCQFHTREDSLRLIRGRNVSAVAMAYLAATWAAMQG